MSKFIEIHDENGNHTMLNTNSITQVFELSEKQTTGILLQNNEFLYTSESYNELRRMIFGV